MKRCSIITVLLVTIMLLAGCCVVRGVGSAVKEGLTAVSLGPDGYKQKLAAEKGLPPPPPAEKTKNDCYRCMGMRTVECSACQGSGTSSLECSLCQGTGKASGMKCFSCRGKGWSICVWCDGKGQKKCISCNGKGYTKR